MVQGGGAASPRPGRWALASGKGAYWLNLAGSGGRVRIAVWAAAVVPEKAQGWSGRSLSEWEGSECAGSEWAGLEAGFRLVLTR